VFSASKWFIGLVKDECSLRDLEITSGAKMIVVGSTIDDVITVQAPACASSGVMSEPESTGRLSGLCDFVMVTMIKVRRYYYEV
jgi:hypothetical protein